MGLLYYDFVSYLTTFISSAGNSVQFSKVFHIAIGDAIAKAAPHIMGTVDIINFPLGGDSVGHTINFRRSSAIAVILSVDMKIETP